MMNDISPSLFPSPSLRGEAEAIQQTAAQVEISLDCFASARNDDGGKRHGEARSHPVLPEGWAYCSVSQVTLKTQMWNPTKDKRNTIKYIDVSAVNREKSLIEEVSEYQTDNAPGRARKIVQTGDTIFATIRPSLRRIVNIPVEFHNEIASTAFCVLRPAPQKIDPDFLFFAVSSEWFVDSVVNLETGASYPAVRDRDIFEQKIPLPMLAEQKQMASVLLQIRQSLLNTYKALDNAQDLKRAAMREVFTRGLRGEAQKQTEIGLVPESWTYTSLGQLCSSPESKIQTGPFGSQLHAHEYIIDGIPVVNPTHLAGNRINHENIPTISEERAQSLSRHRLKTGDILFARRGEIGRLGLVRIQETGWVCGTGCFVVRARNTEIYNPYLAYFFGTEPIVKWLLTNAAGTVMPNLNNTVLGRLPVAFPLLEEQTQIVTLLSAIDDKITLHKRKKAALEALFTSLLHQLMTGKIRVGDLDLESLDCFASARNDKMGVARNDETRPPSLRGGVADEAIQNNKELDCRAADAARNDETRTPRNDGEDAS
jgi:type I restriction enzyme, S subunit